MELNPLEVKKDSRGSLVEAFKLPNDGQVFYVVAKPNQTRGLHFHEHKTETFLVLYGSAEMQIKDRTTGNINEVKVNGSTPMSIKVVPNHTHSITAGEDGCIFLVWSDTLFDEDNPDTYGEEI